MGYFIRNKGCISDYTIEIIKESENFSSIRLAIVTDICSISYRVCADSRHPDLQEIYSDLAEALAFVKENENAVFEISEFLERAYIFITYPNGNTRQYTAQKL